MFPPHPRQPELAYPTRLPIFCSLAVRASHQAYSASIAAHQFHSGAPLRSPALPRRGARLRHFSARRRCSFRRPQPFRSDLARFHQARHSKATCLNSTMARCITLSSPAFLGLAQNQPSILLSACHRRTRQSRPRKLAPKSTITCAQRRRLWSPGTD